MQGDREGQAAPQSDEEGRGTGAGGWGWGGGAGQEGAWDGLGLGAEDELVPCGHRAKQDKDTEMGCAGGP